MLAIYYIIHAFHFHFLEASCVFLLSLIRILGFLEFLGTNLGKILTKQFKNIQDSYQEFQEFLPWTPIERTRHPY